VKNAYPKMPQASSLEPLIHQAQLMHELGARGVAPAVDKVQKAIDSALRQLKSLPIDAKLAGLEPDDLKAIKLLRPPGPRRIWNALPLADYRKRLAGAVLARMAGCALGAPVESWSIEAMERLAREPGNTFPPKDYWTVVQDPYREQYAGQRIRFTRAAMNGVPSDDDVIYTLLGLLVIEEHGRDFSIDDVGATWLKYLTQACTAERSALENLQAGIPARKAALRNNPWVQWIGADIRSDPWAYVAPGWPEKAAELAYRDAYLSHRRNGIYGEMFFAAAISAAFAVDDPMEAIKIGLTEIPRNCQLADAVRWAIKQAPKIGDYKQARQAVDKKFPGMHLVHTINNACLTIFGLAIGGKDVTKVLGQTVAMGLDNDCTAATAGSIIGAIVGQAGVPKHWYKNFNNTIHSYLKGKPSFRIDDLLARFAKQAQQIWS
jgi:ADP-ribosylglycohydrolase